MRILRASFHFDPESVRAPLVVAYVVWIDADSSRRPMVRPLPTFLRAAWPSTILAKLEHLLRITEPNSFDELRALRSRLWSFVEVSPGEMDTALAAEQPPRQRHP